ncbi:MAG: hypothetical protein ACK4KW_08720 [Gemmobacter sp.]
MLPISLAALAVGAGCGWLVAAHLQPRLAWGLAVVFLFGAGVLILAARSAAEYPAGLGLVALAVLVALPAGLGIALGALIARSRRRRRS